MSKQTLLKIESIKEKALTELDKAANVKIVENVRVRFLGRKSELNLILKGLKNLKPEEKKVVGPAANKAKQEITKAIDEKRKEMEEAENLEKEWIDVTLPSNRDALGHRHIISQVQKEIEDIFDSMGFAIGDGVEIDTEWYNFSALNIPRNHPARDMQDTFWVKSRSGKLENEKNRLVARTQTSNAQVKYLAEHKPPLKVIVPGRVFRNEATDVNHEHTFNQFEALVVGKDISVANFKDISLKFFKEFFGKEVKIRLRPGYFPFTEPSFEFDISCTMCDGKGCRTCKNTGWLELAGAGMVNQRVFEAAGYKRGEWQGFAWGFGLNRLAMMKYKIDDIRLFMSGDLRFIRQF